jgi:alpha-L-fucosidase
VLALVTFLATAHAAEESVTQRDARMGWWREARFGMFIHWGPSSVGGVEIGWDRNGNRPKESGGNRLGPDVPSVDPVYDNYHKQFDPKEFIASEWVRVAEEAGMKYMVFTTKHHEGFSMWPTKAREGFDISDTPWKNGQGDVLKDLSDACHAKGMKLGWYYSPRDWTHPDYGQGDNAIYDAFMTRQVSEILTHYGKIDAMWWDSFGEGDSIGYWHADRFLALTRKLQPGIVINNRCSFYVETNRKGLEADFDTPEQTIGNYQIDRPWESCITLVGQNWSFKPGGPIMILDRVIQTLASCATGDGNLLLNVGPMPDGRIEPRQVKLLREVGAWMMRYGESIRGTRGGPFRNGKWGGATFKDKVVYLHLFPGSADTVVLPKLNEKWVTAVNLTGGKVAVTQKDGRLSVQVPTHSTAMPETILKLTFDRPVTRVDGQVQLAMQPDPALQGLTEITGAATYTASSLDPQWSAEKDTLLNGTCQGNFAFHTQEEKDPSILIDLGQKKTTAAVVIENRNDMLQERAASLKLWVSNDGKNWEQVWSATGPQPRWVAVPERRVAGAIVKGVDARYLKLGLETGELGTLHLRSVRIYGH